MQRISIAVAALALCAVVGLAHDTDTDTDKSPPVGYDAEKHQQLIEDAHRGDAEAQYGVAILIPTIADDHGAGFIEAIAWHRKSADQGFAHAQTTLGLAYAYGHGVDVDYAKAARWCRLAAEQGYRDGQLCLGLMYGVGVGVDQDHGESVRLLRLAAEQGQALAQARLGDLYLYGEGVERNVDEAHKWYRLATQRRNDVLYEFAGVEFTSGREVMFHLFWLSRMYQDGEGVARDRIAAYRWWDVLSRWRTELLSKAPSNTLLFSPTQLELDELAAQMTDEELAEARREIDAFLEVYGLPDSMRTY